MNRNFQSKREGTAAILVCMLMIPLLALLAFSIDYGYLLFVKTDLQRAGDQAALAAVRDLVPDAYGNQDLEQVRDTVREYVRANLGANFVVNDSDIEIGRFDPASIYSALQLFDNGIQDTVRVKLRRDDMANSSVSLFFARIFDRNESDVESSSTAVLQKARYMGPGVGVLPFAISDGAWGSVGQGEFASIYGNGQILDENGSSIPGNWGTLDIGPTSNSTADLSTQIRNGLAQSDLDSLYNQGVIPNADYIDASSTIYLNGDTGLSAGLKHAINDVEGQMRIAPIYQSTTGHGGNLTYEVIQWATVKVEGSYWKGSKKSNITVQKSFVYDGKLSPNPDLSDTSGVIEGAYTTPVLVE